MTFPHADGRVADDRSLRRAMFLYGFAMFMLVYMVQPLLPRFVDVFSVTPSEASQALSAATMGMAICLIPASLLVARFARKPLLVGGLALCAVLSITLFFITDFRQLVALRLVFGVVLSALPATALTYLAEMNAPEHQGRAVGLYVAGNAMGGMSGRLLALLLTEWMDWQSALALLGVLALVVSVWLLQALPDAPVPEPVHPGRSVIARVRSLLADPTLLALFGLAFLLSGSIVSVYNYISFRLMQPPYGFTLSTLSFIYALYLLGMLGSARAGRLADRFGRAAVMLWLPLLLLGGLWLTLVDALPALVAGIAIMTLGFFAGHGVASGWVGAHARQDRALASSVYLTLYYLGASVLGTVAGAFWTAGGWTAVVWMNSATGGVALCLAVWLKCKRSTG